mmetsp:Transcript_1194/g.3391  ORF Transcript_1194/g.3391 Transcript_1194/m.3391 type:complete len:248 (+) Transcript_1194:1392-2135(+)
MLVGLVADLQGVRLVHDLLVQAEGVLALALGRLVVPEPLDQRVLLRLRDVAHVLHVGRLRVAGAHDEHLPVRLAVVDEGEHPEDPDGHHLPDGARLLVQLQHVDRVVVAADAGVRVLLVRVLPRLRDGAVVHRRAGLGLVLVVAQRPLLGVLDDRVVLILLVHLHLRGGALRDLADKVQQPLSVHLAGRVGDLVPRGDHPAVVGDVLLPLERVRLARGHRAELAEIEVGGTISAGDEEVALPGAARG